LNRLQNLPDRNYRELLRKEEKKHVSKSETTKIAELQKCYRENTFGSTYPYFAPNLASAPLPRQTIPQTNNQNIFENRIPPKIFRKSVEKVVGVVLDNKTFHRRSARQAAAAVVEKESDSVGASRGKRGKHKAL
jgi:hypothetical protein